MGNLGIKQREHFGAFGNFFPLWLKQDGACGGLACVTSVKHSEVVERIINVEVRTHSVSFWAVALARKTFFCSGFANLRGQLCVLHDLEKTWCDSVPLRTYKLQSTNAG